jgi:hypothetical protein
LRDEVVVEAAPCDQIVVCAAFDDRSGVEDDDQVRVTDGA